MATEAGAGAGQKRGRQLYEQMEGLALETKVRRGEGGSGGGAGARWRQAVECKALVLAPDLASGAPGAPRAPWLADAPEGRAAPFKVLTRTISCPGGLAELMTTSTSGGFAAGGACPRLPAVPRPLRARQCTPPTSPEKSGKELTVWQPALVPPLSISSQQGPGQIPRQGGAGGRRPRAASDPEPWPLKEPGGGMDVG